MQHKIQAAADQNTQEPTQSEAGNYAAQIQISSFSCTNFFLRRKHKSEAGNYAAQISWVETKKTITDFFLRSEESFSCTFLYDNKICLLQHQALQSSEFSNQPKLFYYLFCLRRLYYSSYQVLWETQKKERAILAVRETAPQ